MIYLLFYLLAANACGYYLFWKDKRSARKGQWRIPESRLLLCAALGGALGCQLAMSTLRHKTLHWQFRLGVPLMALLQVAALAWWVGV